MVKERSEHRKRNKTMGKQASRNISEQGVRKEMLESVNILCWK
jgi:hypothetical protein